MHTCVHPHIRRRYDRIIIEASGVSEPRNLREEFLDAADSHQARTRAHTLTHSLDAGDSHRSRARTHTHTHDPSHKNAPHSRQSTVAPTPGSHLAQTRIRLG